MARKNRQPSTPSPAAPPQPSLTTALPWLWFTALTLALAAALFFAWRHISYIEEFPQACDSFGYLQAAQDIRLGHAPHDLPKFTADSPHAQQLITYFQSQHADPAAWQGLLGPQAYNYAPSSGKLINQYPPGIPHLLALFPQGRALTSLYTITLFTLAAAGLLGIACCAHQYRRTRSPLSLAAAGVWAVAIQFALMLLGTTVSYSIDFLILPLLPALLLLYFTHRRPSPWMILLTALAGALLGYAVLMRITVILFIPGLLLLIALGAQSRAARLLRLAAFSAALCTTGILPLLLHQQALTNSLLTPTYGPRDATAPTLAALAPNLAYYFTGDGSLGNWALLTTLIAAIAAPLLLRRSPSNSRTLTPWLLTAATLFIIPTLFYLTHTTTTPYYHLPTILITVLTISLGLAAAARTTTPTLPAAPSPKTPTLLLLLLLTPGLAHIVVACIPPNLLHIDNAPERNLTLPVPLQQPNIWVYGERFTGTLWYFHGIHAQNLLQGTPQTRYLLYRFAFEHGGGHEKQYLLFDVDYLKPIVEEASRAGATFTEIKRSDGRIEHFDGRQVVEITWPPNGPTPPTP